MYRGTTINREQFKHLQEEQLVTSKAFLACSKVQTVATTFATSSLHTHRPVIYEINIRKTGHSIEKYTGRFYEQEVLIENDQFFKIRSIRSNTIILDEMDSSLLSQLEKATAQNIDFNI